MATQYLHRKKQHRELETAFELGDSDDQSLFSHDSEHEDSTLLPILHDNQARFTHHGNASTFSFETIPMIPLTQSQIRDPELQKKVTFFNGLGLVVGAMIGSGMFSSPGPVLASMHGPGTALIVWLVSGFLALSGALCYAELGTMLPMNGGEAVYLGRAFGSLPSFMFEFVSIVVQKPGSLAIICIVLGEYVSRIAYHTYFFNVPHDSDTAVELADSVIPVFLPKLLALATLLIVSVLNMCSVSISIRVQDLLTVVKVLTALVISIIGVVVLSRGTYWTSSAFHGDPFKDIGTITSGQYAIALYSGLWAYDGWNNLNYVSGEMKNPHRDLPRVIFFGFPLVILSYLLANVAYLAALRPEVVMHTNTVVMDFGKKLFGPVGGILFALCVALSCFGTANAGVFTGARIIYVSAKQGHIPAIFGSLNTRTQTPLPAIVLQAVMTSIMISLGSFRGLVNFYSLCAWIFYFLAVLSLLVFRWKEPELKRPYQVWLTTPVLFCIVALFLCTMPFIEAPFESLCAIGFVLLAIPIWLVHVKYGHAILHRGSAWIDCIKGKYRGYQGMEVSVHRTET